MFRTIVLAVNGAESNLPAVDLAARLAAECAAELILVQVVDARPGADTYGRETLANIQARARAQGAGSIKEELRTAGGKGIAHEIVAAASDHDADLIVTGSRGRSAWAGAALGSVSQRILQGAPCPVMVVPGE